jgi:hypothetical protein
VVGCSLPTATAVSAHRCWPADGNQQAATLNRQAGTVPSPVQPPCSPSRLTFIAAPTAPGAADGFCFLPFMPICLRAPGRKKSRDVQGVREQARGHSVQSNVLLTHHHALPSYWHPSCQPITGIHPQGWQFTPPVDAPDVAVALPLLRFPVSVLTFWLVVCSSSSVGRRRAQTQTTKQICAGLARSSELCRRQALGKRDGSEPGAAGCQHQAPACWSAPLVAS